jgi:hypothetical protein
MTDFRALCAEILAILDDYENSQRVNWDDWRSRTRATLAQPEPQGPTDEELDDLWDEVAGYYALYSEAKNYARAALIRWGRPDMEPVPVAERLPGPEDCDAEGWCWWFDGFNWMLGRFEEWYTHWLPHHALPVPQSEDK